MKAFTAFCTGLLFSAGLYLSGMTNPNKVLAFLTLNEAWDPSLILVMGSATTIYFVGFRLARRRARPLLSPEWHIPPSRALTPALGLGALLFGVGWGISGYCPGPALASLFSLEIAPAIFTGGVLLGMGAFHLLTRALPIRR